MALSDSDMLTQAIERNSAAVLSLPSAGMVRYHKTRFLRCHEERVWLESVPSERSLIESLIEDHQLVAVSFKTGSRKCSFSSSIYHLDCNYRFFDTLGVLQAIEMLRPAHVRSVQRRSHYRVPVRDIDRFKVDLWRIAEHVHISDDGPELGYIPAIVHDLSVGGIGVIFKTRPKLITDQRMRVLLHHGDSPPMLLEARTGPLRQSEGGQSYEVGIQFQGLQESLRGRQMLTELTRIVHGLQLAEAKRVRGVAG